MTEPQTKTTRPVRAEDSGTVNKILKVAAYPIALISGFWVLTRDVHDQVYANLKRYGVFKDILSKMEPLNEGNVSRRLTDAVEKSEFLAYSMLTKRSYSKQVIDRMDHMGLGNKLRDFPAKWNYITQGGQRSAMINGLTVFGIAIGAILTIANTKSVQHLFDEKHSAQER